MREILDTKTRDLRIYVGKRDLRIHFVSGNSRSAIEYTAKELSIVAYIDEGYNLVMFKEDDENYWFDLYINKDDIDNLYIDEALKIKINNCDADMDICLEGATVEINNCCLPNLYIKNSDSVCLWPVKLYNSTVSKVAIANCEVLCKDSHVDEISQIDTIFRPRDFVCSNSTINNLSLHHVNSLDIDNSKITGDMKIGSINTKGIIKRSTLPTDIITSDRNANISFEDCKYENKPVEEQKNFKTKIKSIFKFNRD